MTREEATYLLNNLRSVAEGEEDEAIDMAIEALSAKPTIPTFAESEEAYKAWTGEEMGKTGDEINEMNKEIIKDILKMMPTAYLLEALGVDTVDELTEQADRPTMTEEVREALMRLTMCAREECDMCKYEHNCSFDKQVEMATESMNIIANAFKPADRPHGEWIPCSERLPEDIRPVLVTWKNIDPASYYQYIVGKHFIGTAHYYRGKWYWYSSTTEDMLAEYGRYDFEEFDEAIECIAWMPLPTPYKGGDTE